MQCSYPIGRPYITQLHRRPFLQKRSSDPQPPPCPSFPCFWGIPCFFFFFPARNSLFFLELFFLFSRDFRGFDGDKQSLFFCSFPCLFPKTRKGRTGQYFPKVLPYKQGGRTAVQVGAVLPYKWEAYCRVFLSLKLRSQESTTIQMGGVLPYKLEVYCCTFQTSCRGWDFRNIALSQMCLEGADVPLYSVAQISGNTALSMNNKAAIVRSIIGLNILHYITLFFRINFA